MSRELICVVEHLLGSSSIESISAISLVKHRKLASFSRHVWKIDLDNEVYYIKKFTNHSFLTKLNETLQRSKAAYCHKISSKLISEDFSVAAPILSIDKKQYGLISESIYVTRELNGVPAQTAYSIKKRDNNESVILEKYTDLAISLLANNFYHVDYRPGNIMIVDNEMVLFDVDDISYSRYRRIIGTIRMLCQVDLVFLVGIKRGTHSESWRQTVIQRILSGQDFPRFVHAAVKKAAIVCSSRKFLKLQNRVIDK